jgi:hypothetical protein
LTIKASKTTLRNKIHKLGFHSCIAWHKPFLNEKQINNRPEFARVHQDWTVEDWKKVIWTDESSFEIGKNFRQVWHYTEYNIFRAENINIDTQKSWAVRKREKNPKKYAYCSHGQDLQYEYFFVFLV